MTLRICAPATTANVGPGFDCVGIALDLWNEVEVERGDGPVDRDHLGVRAFERLTPADGWTFRWTDRIPRARGLGSSAATVALGLVAGELARGGAPDPETLLAAGVELEGHADNLAAALAGGVCLTWDGRIARIGDGAPAAAVVLVPGTTVSTEQSRRALPATVPHADAAVTAGRAALLGAALASGSTELFTAALHDRLHEPYREQTAPWLGEVRARLPVGGLGATLSGSGPSVVVWAEPRQAAACAAELERRFPRAQILQLAVARDGAATAGR
jgi:homoserine kinase